MLNFLKGVVGGSGAGLKDLPYNIGEPYSSAWSSWSHFRGTSRDDGSPVSIFSLSGNSQQDARLAAGRNGVKRLRTVRHPNILSFLYSTEVETFDGSGTKVTIYIVTEPAMPLSEEIKELSLEGTQRDEYYAWGLHQIAKAVSFLNNDCKLTLDWKLHALDVLSEYDGANGTAAGPMLVYPHVATGFSDTSAFLRELTLKSMLLLAPKLSQRNLSGSLLKYLSKLQVDEEPAIRTNTTILLGNIASYLNEGTRKRVLINAFTVRALRDTFSPARGAGVMALCATSSYYDTNEIATRILPNIVVLTIDPDSDVRSKVFQAVDQFLQILKQSNEKSYVEDTTDAGSLGLGGMPGNVGLLEWAMSSLTLKGKSSDQAPVAAAYSVRPVTATTSAASSGGFETPSSAPVSRVSSSTDFADQPLSPTSTDGWGEIENGIHEEKDSDKDGWDDIEPLEELKPSPALANIQAAQKRPVSQPKPQATNLRPKSTMKAAKDNDDDLWGSIAAPPPKVPLKPLKAKTSGAFEDDDPWAAIAAPTPTTKAKPLSAGRGRGTKPAAPKLGAQRKRTSSSG
ncbi:hypothetical protein V6N12_063458 [Hibiscus sabdariffa]|uniref:Protein kinase domain-containing protein n=1 Tax=Hibiscus sabdariffa TaxID=183260 RepID=A0ABR2FBU8_9ROSI